MTHEYIHHPLNQECTAIGGHYVTIKEVRMPYANGDVLYTVGHAVVDTSCCGSTGCGFATVYGIVSAWQYRRNNQGLLITQVIPINDRKRQADLRDSIKGTEVVQQVNFFEGG